MSAPSPLSKTETGTSPKAGLLVPASSRRCSDSPLVTCFPPFQSDVAFSSKEGKRDDGRLSYDQSAKTCLTAPLKVNGGNATRYKLIQTRGLQTTYFLANVTYIQIIQQHDCKTT